MAELGSPDLPLRVAVVGAGPAGFYAAELLLRNDIHCEVDLFESLPCPYGLVRHGVAPDHPKMRTVINRFDKTGIEENFNYFGNTKLGSDVSVDTLREYYDAILISTGAQKPRRLGIPGEELEGSYSAEQFINWYNGHPAIELKDFDLSSDTAVVVGNGNVALDIARILMHTPEELAKTDMATPIIEKLAASKVKTVYIAGRRGPVQASFTSPEIREFDHLENTSFHINEDAMALDAEDLEELEFKDHGHARKFMPIFEGYADQPSDNEQHIKLLFLRSPVSIEGDGKIEKITLQTNRLSGPAGSRRPNSIDETETISCGLVFSCIGYRGRPIEGIPFDDKWGGIPNVEGRVTVDGEVQTGLYTSGWIKRGPSGVIGTNKVDSKETILNVVEDAANLTVAPNRSSAALREQLISEGKRPINFAEWKKIDDAEVARAKGDKPREKFLTVEEMLAVLD
jgi:ferredoxin/flavodoxin---NADP+ reductase